MLEAVSAEGTHLASTGQWAAGSPTCPWRRRPWGCSPSTLRSPPKTSDIQVYTVFAPSEFKYCSFEHAPPVERAARCGVSECARLCVVGDGDGAGTSGQRGTVQGRFGDDAAVGCEGCTAGWRHRRHAWMLGNVGVGGGGIPGRVASSTIWLASHSAAAANGISEQPSANMGTC